MTHPRIAVAGGEPSGLTDAAFAASTKTLEAMAGALNADVTLIRQRRQEAGVAGEFLVRVRPPEDDFIEVRVAVVGNVDAGVYMCMCVCARNVTERARVGGG